MLLGLGDVARVAVDRLLLTATGAGREIVRAGPPSVRAVALSFDDGPSPANTHAVLDLLESHGARATFFVVGELLCGCESILARTITLGHELGNHTFTHPRSVRLGRRELVDEIARTNAAIESVGARATLVRPPFGKDRRRFVQVARELEMKVALWSLDSADTRGAAGADIASALVRRTTPGAVILLHDGGAQRPETLAACAAYLPAMIDQGYRFVTISELLTPSAPVDGSAG